MAGRSDVSPRELVRFLRRECTADEDRRIRSAALTAGRLRWLPVLLSPSEFIRSSTISFCRRLP